MTLQMPGRSATLIPALKLEYLSLSRLKGKIPIGPNNLQNFAINVLHFSSMSQRRTKRHHCKDGSD